MNSIIQSGFLLTLCFVAFVNASAQKNEEVTHREVNVHYNDSSIKATILLEEKKIKPKNHINYYWYYNNSIKVNQGGYKGRVLDGAYQVIGKGGNLLRQGELKKGYQTGEWKSWELNGNLSSIYNWKKGHKTGTYQKFKGGKVIEEGSYKNGKQKGTYRKYENEKLIEKGKYKKGKLNGKIISYKNDTLFSEIKYKNGAETIVKKKEIEPKKAEQKVEKEKNSNKWWQFWKKGEEKQQNEKVKKSKAPSTKKDKKKKDPKPNKDD